MSGSRRGTRRRSSRSARRRRAATDGRHVGVSRASPPGPVRPARLAAAQGPAFDAWAHHPYPTAGTPADAGRPLAEREAVPAPAVREQRSRSWFGRSDVPIWITEYGVPDEAVPLRRLAAPAGRLHAPGARDGAAGLRGCGCSSGSRSATAPATRGRAASTRRPGRRSRRWRRSPAIAWAVRARNATAAVSSRSAVQQVRRPGRLTVAYFSGVGAVVGADWRVLLERPHGRLGPGGRPDPARTGRSSCRFGFRPRAGGRYELRVTGSDVHGNGLAADADARRHALEAVRPRARSGTQACTRVRTAPRDTGVGRE